MVKLTSSAILVVVMAATRVGAFQVAKPQHVSSDTSLNAISRRDMLSMVPTTAAAAAAILVVAAPLEARAAVKKGVEPEKKAAVSEPPSYQGVFSDPKHPKGYRVLVGNAKAGTMTLQDDPASPVYHTPFRVRTDKKNQAVTLTMDFSAKGGPKNIDATLGTKATGRSAVTTLTFMDNNVWTKDTGIIGVYRDGLNPKYTRVIRKNKGSKLSVDLINGAKTTTITARAGSQKVSFDFPGKAGDMGTVDSVKNTISFADGNVWTKL